MYFGGLVREHKRSCAWCGKEFMALSTMSRYHSVKCAKDAKNEQSRLYKLKKRSQ